MNPKVIHFVAEVKSHWSEKGNLTEDFDERMKRELISHWNITKIKLEKENENLPEGEKKWSLPDYGYAFSINVGYNKIEIFIRKLDFNKKEWMKW